MQVRSNRVRSIIAAIGLATGYAAPARADLLSSLLPAGVPGYDTQDGVTVQSRLHPDQESPGLRAGAFQFWPRLEESTGFRSDALSGPYPRSSWEVITNPSVTIGSDWSRDAFGAVLSLQNTNYLALPAQSRTDGSVSAGGRIDIGQDQIAIAAAHLSQHEDQGQVNTLASDRPVAFRADNFSGSYTANAGRWSIVPELRVTNWSYGNTTLLGVPSSQAYRDRAVAEGDVTIRYEWAPLRNILFVVRALGQDYTHTPPGQPRPDSVSTQMLIGLDYDSDAVWHWRLLAGGETRGFASPLYPRQNNLIVEAAVGWLPTGMTTINAAVSRESSDAAQAGVSGLMLTTGRLTIDHEYLRNLLLQASVGLQRADFFQGGYQNGFVAGVGATWVVNQSMRLSATYDQTDLHGPSNPAAGLIGGYSRGIGLLTLRLGL